MYDDDGKRGTNCGNGNEVEILNSPTVRRYISIELNNIQV